MDKNFKKSDDYQSRWGFYLKSEILNGRVFFTLPLTNEISDFIR